MLLAMFAMAGCQSASKAQGSQPLHAPPSQPDPKSRLTRDDGPTAAQMHELLVRLQSLEVDNAHLKKRLSDQYMQAVAEKQAQLEAEKRLQARPVPGTGAYTDPQSNPSQKAHTATTADPEQLSRTELLDALVNKIVAGKDSPRVKALMVAALSLASDHKQMDPRLFDALNPKAREQVTRFHQMVAVAFDELASGSNKALTRRDILQKIDEVFGAQPLKIDQLALCRRVDSYGVYEPFATTRFLAGRKNRVLVYVELENFKHELLDDGQYEVRLEQTVELYEATGTSVVWRQGPVELVDVSRKKRRDFFVVYPVDLPARLTAGTTYRLKVRVSDKHGGTIHEQTMHDIQVVADEALVGRAR